MMHLKFKEIVDSVLPDIAFEKAGLTEKYVILGLEKSYVFATGHILTVLVDRIKSIFELHTANRMSADFFNLLERTLVAETILNGVDNQVYLSIAKILKQVRIAPFDFSLEDDWKELILTAKRCYSISFKSDEGSLDIHLEYPEHFATANACLRLRELGCVIEIVFGEATVVSGMDELVDRIEKEIKTIGGVSVVNAIMASLNSKGLYAPGIERYIFLSPQLPDATKIPSAIPYGYIYNLAVKHPFSQSFTAENNDLMKQKLDNIFEWTTLILQSKDWQSYSIYEQLFVDPENLLEFAFENVVYDAAIAIPQSSPKLEIRFLESLYNWVDDAALRREFGFSLAGYSAVAKYILQNVRDIHWVTHFLRSHIIQHVRVLGIGKAEVNVILNIICHDPGYVNSNFKYLEDFAEVNVGNFPLVRTKPNEFILCGKSFSCMAFNERIFNFLEKEYGNAVGDKNVGKKVGMALESFILSTFTKHGVAFAKGTFSDITGKEAECDMVIESDKQIVLVEIKKKRLTDDARGGKESSLVFDLLWSLMHSQIQAGKFELTLRKRESVELNDAGSKRVISWNKREIIRVSVTQYEYYGFHDKIFTNQFLSMLVGRHLVVNDPAMNKSVIAANKLLDEWSEQYRELEEGGYLQGKWPFLNSWFISYGQLELILDGVTSAENFITSLLKGRAAVFGAKNYYAEHYFKKGLK